MEGHDEAEASILWHLMLRTDSLEKTLMLGKTKGRRRRGWQRMRRLDSITNSVEMILSKVWELAMDREAWRVAIHGVTMSWTRLSIWTELNWRHEGKPQSVLAPSFYVLFPPLGACPMQIKTSQEGGVNCIDLREVLGETFPAVILILDSQTSEWLENGFLLFKPPDL